MQAGRSHRGGIGSACALEAQRAQEGRPTARQDWAVSGGRAYLRWTKLEAKSFEVGRGGEDGRARTAASFSLNFGLRRVAGSKNFAKSPGT